MSSVLGFVVGLLQSAMSLLGFVQAHPELPQPAQDQAVQVATQAVGQATKALSPQQIVDQYGKPTNNTQSTNNNSVQLYNYAEGNYDVKYADFNFDDLQDKVVVANKNNFSDTYRGAYPHKDIYVQTTSGKYILSDELTNIINGTGLFKVDSARKRIVTYGAGSCCTHYGMEYDVVPNIGIREVYRITEDQQGADVPKGKIKVTIETIEQGRKDGAQGWKPALGLESTNFYDLATYKPWTGSTNSSNTSPSNATSGMATKTYTDSMNGFSIEYPSLLELKTTQLGTGSFQNASAQGLVSVSSQSPYGTKNQYGGPVSLTISMSSDPDDVGHCLSYYGSAKRIGINGVDFYAFSYGDAAMGQSYNTESYRAIHNGACYSINKETHSYRTESQAEANQQNESLAAADAQIEPIVQSFKFIASAGDTAVPPTCTVSSDKYMYALGDIIVLTWNSKNATRVLWDQAIEKNTGIRKVIVPPEGTPGVSGTGSTVANIVGDFQPIKLQVTGPGGFGNCQTSVTVTQSNAKPSITIDRVQVDPSSGLSGNGHEGVTISGTATNGGLYNDDVNIVLIDASYPGPFDKASIYADAFGQKSIFYSGGADADLTEDSKPVEVWYAKNFLPAGLTQVRALAYPFYSSGFNSPTQPLANVVLPVSR